MNDFRCKESELLNKRYEKLSAEYMALQNEFHATKLKLNESLSKEEEYKQSIHQISVKMKFLSKELEQSQSEQVNVRTNNHKQTEQISQLNHDIKAMFRDLERAQNQLMQSQQMIANLEKQYFHQTQQLQQTRNQLQMQIQLNMQNMSVLNNMSGENQSVSSIDMP